MLITLVGTACALLALMAQSASAFVPCPSGGNRAGAISEWETTWPPNRETNPKGVTMCLGEQGIWGTDKGWLQIVDLGDGARIRLEAQVAWSRRNGERNLAELDEPNTLYTKRTAEDWYAWIREQAYSPESPDEMIESGRLFSVTNATFFKDDRNEHPTTRLPFPLMATWRHNTLGVSELLRDEDWEAEKKSLEIGSIRYPTEEEPEINQAVKLEGFPARYGYGDLWEYFFNRGEPIGEEEIGVIDGLVSFTPSYRVGESNRRNYLGVYRDTVYIFTSDAEYTNEQAYEIMREIQPGIDVIQLDGGGSAQLYSAYGEMDSSIPIFNRTVPNVLAIYRAQ